MGLLMDNGMSNEDEEGFSPGGLAARLEEINNRTENLQKSVSRLAERLEPFMAPDHKEKQGTIHADSITSGTIHRTPSPMGQRMKTVIEEIAATDRRIREITERIDL